MSGRVKVRFVTDGEEPNVDFADDIDLSARDADVAVVTDPTEDVGTTAPTICYADCDPADVPDPGRFDAFVRRGDAETLETQVRWLSTRRSEADGPSDDGRSRLRRLYEGTTTLVAAETTAELYARTLDIAETILDFDNSTVCVHEGDRFRVRANEGDLDLDETFSDDRGILGETYRTGESLLVDDVRDCPVAAPTDPDHRSLLSVPIGEFGVLQAFSSAVAAYDERDLHLAELLVSYVAETASRIESEREVRENRVRVEALHRGTVDLAAVADREDLFELTVQITEEILAFDLSHVGVVEDDHLVPAVSSAEMSEDGSTEFPLDGDSIAAKTYRTGETYVVSDLAAETEGAPVKQQYRSALSVPIGDVGVFQAISFEPNAFDETDAELTELLTRHVAVTADRIRAEERLREERDRSTALFEEVSDAGVAYEVDAAAGTVRVRDVNRTFEETFGVGAADAVGEDLTALVVPDDVSDPAELRVADGESHRSEVRRCGPEGERDFILNVVPYSEKGNAEGFAVYTDITQRKRREAELERQNERLEEFTNIVSHDLRNPLGVARGHLELARETGSEESFETAADALGRMESLIDDLLSLARQGTVVGDTTETDLRTVARRAWRGVDTAEATLTVPETATVVADGDRLVELLGNLFRNSVEHGSTSGRLEADDAVEHGSTGDAAVTVTVGPLADESGFYVADDGPGIAPDRREAVFEMGETTGGDGIGYGLSIVRRIAEAHGWSVSVCDAESGGARFEFAVEE